MSNFIISRLNFIDSTFYPVYLFRGEWTEEQPLENLKDRFFDNTATSVDADPAKTLFEINYRIERSIRVSYIPYIVGASRDATVRMLYTVDIMFEDVSIDVSAVAGTTTVHVVAGDLTATITEGDYFAVGDALDIYIAQNTITMAPFTTGTLTFVRFNGAGLATDIDAGTRIYCLSGNYASPSRDTGIVDYWPIVYDWGTLPYESPSFYDGKNTAEERAVIRMPFTDIIPNGVLAKSQAVLISDPDSPGGNVRLPRIVTADGWQGSLNMAYGMQMGLQDNTVISRAVSGAEYYDIRDIASTFSFNVDQLPFNEALQLAQDIQRTAGLHGQVVFIMDPDDTKNRHRTCKLCTFVSLQDLQYNYFQRVSAAFNLKEVVG